MLDVISKILSNEYLMATIVGGIGWLTHKAFGARKDSKAAKVTAALETSAMLMAQYIYVAPKTADAPQFIAACKGIVAIQFGKIGISEAGRAPYQYLIDLAISKAVHEWMKRHPAVTTVKLPIVDKLPA